MTKDVSGNVLSITASLVAAHVSKTPVQPAELPALIVQVYRSLIGVGTPPPAVAPEPAVPIKKSIEPDFIICLEDGRRLKTLKRHLMTAYNLTPEAYRARWNLPPDYPMVAPSYANRRSTLAKEIGLGVRGRAKA
jgi:predicted transcriptional regulator